MSEITGVLTNSLSPDAATRNGAEQALAQAAETNFPLYLISLVQELAKEENDTSIRAAAGIALKNAFTARDATRQPELQAKWLQQTDDETKSQIKNLTLQTLGSQNARAGAASAQVIAAIAALELPREQWQDLMSILVKSISEGSDNLKQASLTTIGYICESQDLELRASLVQHSNAILTAVVQGARQEETNIEVRLSAITALGDSLEFVGNNFKHEGERNYIMQVVCEATQSDDDRVKQGAFGCLNRIMSLYYENMRFYMEKALFGLTIIGMRSDDEDVAKLAVEFWSTVCEEEINIEDENSQVENSDQMRPFYNFARVAAPEVVPELLNLLAKQDEDATDDEYNLSRAAYQCLSLYAQAVRAAILPHVLSFVEANLGSEDWHLRDAAVSAFGAVMEGPEEKVLEPIVRNGLAAMIEVMSDANVNVRDSTAYTLGRITEACPEAIDATHLQPLLEALFTGLASHPKMAASCCWTLMNLAERFAGDISAQQNALTPHFNTSIEQLVTMAGQSSCDSSTRTAVYEVINSFVQNSAVESLATVAQLSDMIIKRLEETIPMQSQVVSVEDRITLSDIQTSLCSVLQGIIFRLDTEIAPQGDRIMQALLSILSTVGPKSPVPEAVFAAIGALSTAVGEDFIKYMEAFSPFLYNALSNQEEPALCLMAIGLVSDITRSLGPATQPYCDQFMNYLLNNLRSESLSNQFKPTILQCFGDIALAIEGAFETYLVVVAQVLQQAATIDAPTDGSSYDLVDYVISLREGIMDAWGGIIPAMKGSGKAASLQPYVESIFSLLNSIAVNYLNRSEPLLRSAMGVIGDLCDAFPNGELKSALQQEWLTGLIKETKSNRDFAPRTIETARWARELVKRQTAA